MNLIDAIRNHDAYNNANAQSQRNVIALAKKLKFDGRSVTGAGLTDSDKAAIERVLVGVFGVLKIEDQRVWLADHVEPAEIPAATPVKTNGSIETREPADQNEHTLCIVNSKQLTKNAMLVTMVANVEISLESFRTKKTFGKAKKELTSEYLAGKTGLSRPTVIKSVDEAVKLGFLARLDNGKGGRNQQNKATYRATLPTYFN